MTKFIPLFISIVISIFKNDIIWILQDVSKDTFKKDLNKSTFLYAEFNNKEFYEVDESQYEKGFLRKNKQKIKQSDMMDTLMERLDFIEKKISKIEADLLNIRKVRILYNRKMSHLPLQSQNKIKNLYRYEKKLENQFEKNIQQNVNLSEKINKRNNQVLYKIHAGAFYNYKNAMDIKNQIQKLGIPIISINKKKLYNRRNSTNNNLSNHIPSNARDFENQKSYIDERKTENYKQGPNYNKEFADITYFLMYDSSYADDDDYNRNNEGNKPYTNRRIMKYKKSYVKRKKTKMDNYNNYTNKIHKVYRIISEKDYPFEEANKIIQMLSTLGYRAYIKRI